MGNHVQYRLRINLATLCVVSWYCFVNWPILVYSILAAFLGEHQHIGMDPITSYSYEELRGRCTDDGEIKPSLPKTFQTQVRDI